MPRSNAHRLPANQRPMRAPTPRVVRPTPPRKAPPPARRDGGRGR